MIPKGIESPEAKPRDSNIPRVLLLLVNDPPNLLVSKTKKRDPNNISYYFYSANVPNHFLMFNNTQEEWESRGEAEWF